MTWAKAPGDGNLCPFTCCQTMDQGGLICPQPVAVQLFNYAIWPVTFLIAAIVLVKQPNMMAAQEGDGPDGVVGQLHRDRLGANEAALVHCLTAKAAIPRNLSPDQCFDCRPERPAVWATSSPVQRLPYKDSCISAAI